MKIIGRKGSDNDSDALSRREDLEDLTDECILDNPILKKKIDEYDAGSFERDLEDFRESLLEMTHLKCDHQFVKEISNGYSQESSFDGDTLPVGVIFDPNTVLYWIADKVYVPNT
jgi:C1A family cysteine protease